jgi:hypothetical protein
MSNISFNAGSSISVADCGTPGRAAITSFQIERCSSLARTLRHSMLQNRAAGGKRLASPLHSAEISAVIPGAARQQVKAVGGANRVRFLHRQVRRASNLLAAPETVKAISNPSSP